MTARAARDAAWDAEETKQNARLERLLQQLIEAKGDK